MVIQKCFRGFLGRKRALKFSTKLAAEGRSKHFHQAAIEIQRMWRGSHSRRRIHSFYERKKYLESVLNVGERLRQNMDIHHEALSQTELMEKVRVPPNTSSSCRVICRPSRRRSRSCTRTAPTAPTARRSKKYIIIFQPPPSIPTATNQSNPMLHAL